VHSVALWTILIAIFELCKILEKKHTPEPGSVEFTGSEGRTAREVFDFYKLPLGSADRPVAAASREEK